MEKNQNGCPKAAVCEKIFKAITFGPAFSTIRRISSRQQTPSPAKYARNPPLPSSDIKTKLSEVPIKFDYTTRLSVPPTEKPKPMALNGSSQKNGSTQNKPSTDMVQSGKPNKSKPKAEKSKKATQHYDDSFSAYIYKTKKRIMSPDQDSGEKKLVGSHGGIGKDHQFSDYIDQTKRKIRTTPSMKDKSDSFFK